MISKNKYAWVEEQLQEGAARNSDKVGLLSRTEYRLYNKRRAFGLGKATLTGDLRGIVLGIPAPGAEVEVVKSTKTLSEIIYRSQFGEKTFTIPTEFLG